MSISTREKLGWAVLAFFPSSLLLGVTTYITMDIASLPLFWVIPLAIYLLTFILAFGRTPKMVKGALNAQIVLVPLTVLAIISQINHASLILLLHLATFFVVALGCHGVLAGRKPHTRHLTEYYLWISVGGMLGGVFNAILAPQLFTSLIEYPVMLGLALLARPGSMQGTARERKLDIVVPVLILLILGPLVALNNASQGSLLSALLHNEQLLVALAVLACVGITMLAASLSPRPIRFALSFLVLLVVLPLARNDSDLIYAERNFFGVSRVFHRPSDNAMVFKHGTTIHGVQSLDPKERLMLTTYYPPVRDVFTHITPALKNAPAGMIGLGAGTLACAGYPKQRLEFYEINPAVARIASTPDYFTFLRDCGTDVHITLGDGRLEIAKAPDHRYGIIVVDAFSSDSIPMHLLTREALQVYLSKLADKGMLAFNVSNRHLNLVTQLNALANDAGLSMLVRRVAHPANALATPSEWVLLARASVDFGDLEKAGLGWQKPEGSSHVQPWTDNYSDIFETLFKDQ